MSKLLESESKDFFQILYTQNADQFKEFLINRLKTAKVDGKVISFLYTYLSNRFIQSVAEDAQNFLEYIYEPYEKSNPDQKINRYINSFNHIFSQIQKFPHKLNLIRNESIFYLYFITGKDLKLINALYQIFPLPQLAVLAKSLPFPGDNTLMSAVEALSGQESLIRKLRDTPRSRFSLYERVSNAFEELRRYDIPRGYVKNYFYETPEEHPEYNIFTQISDVMKSNEYFQEEHQDEDLETVYQDLVQENFRDFILGDSTSYDDQILNCLNTKEVLLQLLQKLGDASDKQEELETGQYSEYYSVLDIAFLCIAGESVLKENDYLFS